MGLNWRAAVWLSVLGIAAALIVVGLVCRTIALHPDAAGFISIVTPAEAAVDPHAPTPPIIDIQDNPGGNVKEFYDHFAELSKQGAIVRLHGYCASSCTLILLREFTGIKACAVDDKALFAFHKPFAFDKRHNILKTKASVRVSRQIWASMLANFPYDVYRLLKDARIPSATEGDPPDDLFVVPAIFFVPRCEASK